MRDFQELRETTNSYVYNKLYKIELERRGKIKCSICAVNRGENDERKSYGTTRWYNDLKGRRTRYPSWKLVSKNRKQWMKKNLIIEDRDTYWGSVIDIKW